MAKLQHRYPGTRPFIPEERLLFFGRDDDSEKLSNLIMLERTVVLFGKSGLGKSSLLQARIIPKFKEEKGFQCIYIRFFSNQPGRNTNLVEIVKQIVIEYGNISLRENIGNDIIYLLRKIAIASSLHRFLLIFEQAEEIFEYPNDEIDLLVQVLRDVVYLKDHQFGVSSTSNERHLDVHILFSIKSDRVSMLDRFSAYIPDILKHTYELLPLNKIQALDAIITPALYARNDFIFESPRFQYHDTAIDKILSFLTLNGKTAIEAFQLQIICSYIERMIIHKPSDFINEDGRIEVSPLHVEKLQEIYDNYYSDLISTISKDEDLSKIRRMIENGLIIKERRITVDQEVLTDTYGVTTKQFDALVEAHLLRRETNSSGGYSYEIAHDAFISAIIKAKIKRENQESIEKLLNEKDAAFTELKAYTDDVLKKRRLALFVSGIMALLVIVVMFLLFRLNEEKDKTQKLNSQLEKQKEAAYDAKREAEERLKKLQISQANSYLREADQYLHLPKPEKYYQSALENLEKAYEIYPDESIKLKIDSVRFLKNKNHD